MITLTPHRGTAVRVGSLLTLVAFALGATAGRVRAQETGYIQVEGPVDVSVFLDGKPQGQTSKELGDPAGLIVQDVTAGQHRVRLSMDGFLSQDALVRVTKGAVVMHKASPFAPRILEPRPAEKTSGVGKLLIQSLPIRCSISCSELSLKAEGKTSDQWTREGIAVGSYELQFSAMNKTLSHIVEIRAAETAHLMVNFLTGEVEHLNPGRRGRRSAGKVERREFSVRWGAVLADVPVAATWHLDGDQMAFFCANSVVHSRRVFRAEEDCEFPHPHQIVSLAYLDDSTIVVPGPEGSVEVWELNGHKKPTSTRALQFKTGVASAVALAASSDGQLLAVAGAGDRLTVLESSSGKLRRRITGHDGDTRWLRFSPDVTDLASASADGRIRVCRVASGELIHSWVRVGCDPRAVAFDLIGRVVAIADYGGALTLHDLQDGTELHELGGHAGSVSSLSFSPDGGTLVSGGDDGTVRLWDVATGEQVQLLRNERAAVELVSFGPRGRLIAVADLKGEFEVWQGGTSQVRAGIAPSRPGARRNPTVRLRVVPGAAHDAGLRDGDVLVRIGTRAIRRNADLWAAMSMLRPGDTIEFEVVRGEQPITVSVSFPQK